MSNFISKTRDLVIDLEEDTATERPVVIDEDRVVQEDAGANIIDEDIDPRDELPKRARQNADGSVTLPLYFAKTLTTRKEGKTREREFTELTFHRLNGADQRAIGAASSEMSAVVAFGRSIRLNQAVMNALFDQMDAADIADGGRVLNHFLTSGQKTGR